MLALASCLLSSKYDNAQLTEMCTVVCEVKINHNQDLGSVTKHLLDHSILFFVVRTEHMLQGS